MNISYLTAQAYGAADNESYYIIIIIIVYIDHVTMTMSP